MHKLAYDIMYSLSMPSVQFQILCLQLPVAYGGVGIWSELRGVPLDQMSTEEIDLAVLGSDVIQLMGVLAIIKYGLLSHHAPDRQQQVRGFTFLT